MNFGIHTIPHTETRPAQPRPKHRVGASPSVGVFPWINFALSSPGAVQSPLGQSSTEALTSPNLLIFPSPFSLGSRCTVRPSPPHLPPLLSPAVPSSQSPALLTLSPPGSPQLLLTHSSALLPHLSGIKKNTYTFLKLILTVNSKVIIISSIFYTTEYIISNF